MRALVWLLLMSSSLLARAAGPDPTWVAKGFAQPESALYVPEQDLIYVSNIDGEPGAKDGKGFISRVAPDGTIVKRAWISGLNAPKGMAYKNGLLYVSDIDQLLVIDTGNGRVIKRYPALGAKFFNDVAVDKAGRVYVSDTGTNAIWRLAGERFVIWVQEARLNHPNGLLAERGLLVVAPYGTQGESGEAGFLLTVNLETKEINYRFGPIGVGSLDGLVPDGQDGYYLSDFEHSNVYHVHANGDHLLWVLQEPPGTADLGLIPGKLVLVPHMKEGTLSAYKVERLEKPAAAN